MSDLPADNPFQSPNEQPLEPELPPPITPNYALAALFAISWGVLTCGAILAATTAATWQEAVGHIGLATMYFMFLAVPWLRALQAAQKFRIG